MQDKWSSLPSNLLVTFNYNFGPRIVNNIKVHMNQVFGRKYKIYSEIADFMNAES